MPLLEAFFYVLHGDGYSDGQSASGFNTGWSAESG
jgi:hypothetical protein